jgi:FtsP/CotA-like multicopper oxidase with cupredoxin domain
MRISLIAAINWLALWLLAATPAAAAPAATTVSLLPVVVANDNHTPAGRLRGGVLQLQLELRAGRWYPEDEGGPYRDIYAFAEAGHAPQNSGPLIRVPQGTRLQVKVHNDLPQAAIVHGLHSHPGDVNDSVRLAPGEVRDLEFIAGDPGTYLYWATTSGKSIADRHDAETGLSGAFIVDPPGARSDDRVFVIGLWSHDGDQGIATLNGKSWPYTDHLSYRVGETVRWRIVNGSFDPHAMHLHGFYFDVDGAGDGETYQRYSGDDRPHVVTEQLDPGHAYDMTWTPERQGNWLFHCHMLLHMSLPKALHPKDSKPAIQGAHDHGAGMGGLVIGITVQAGAGPPAAAPAAPAATAIATHKLELVIAENPAKVPLYRLDVNDARMPPKAGEQQDPSLLGPPIVLTSGESAAIEVRNLTGNPTAIHWHGIELESYYDGVPGWTGSGGQTTPAIAPGGSFVAKMTPPHAGTFIYHTHWHDEAQLANGVYGPLIVLEPGARYDPGHDLNIVVSIGDYAPFGLMLLVNGWPEPLPLELKTGESYRLRLINITTNESDARVRLVSQQLPTQWKLIAQDGADLPAARQQTVAADIALTVGSTRDVEIHSDVAGNIELQVAAPLFGALVMLPIHFVAPK